MNQKKAKLFRKFIKTMRPELNAKTVQYSNPKTNPTQVILDPTCFKGLYKLTKKEYRNNTTDIIVPHST
jgi:hypothetical protein